MKIIKLFKTANGKKPFREWLDKLKSKQDKARIRRRIDRLELGHYGDCKRLAKDLFELRLFFGPGYRLYYTEQGNEIIILLLGGDKSSQTRDVAQATAYLKTLTDSVGEYDEIKSR